VPGVGSGPPALRGRLTGMGTPVRISPSGRRLRARGACRRPAEAGIALIAVLWLTVLLTVIATGFAFSMRSEALAARNALSLAQARAANGGPSGVPRRSAPSEFAADHWTTARKSLPPAGDDAALTTVPHACSPNTGL